MDKTSKELTVCIDFNCNNDCISCMLKDIKKDLRPFSFEEFREIIDETLRLNQYETLILSGAEVTLNKELIRFIEYAKQLSAFKHIRIQTNGRRLSDINYCRDLMNVGIDEFFVSVYGPDAITHEAITRSAHSFEETLQGIANLNTLGATIITNTVISTLNYTLLQNIVVKLSTFSSVKEMQFWNYWPMSETDDLSLLASYRDVLPFLVEAIKEGQKRDIKIIVKYFPACLLDKYVAALDNSQADTIIDKIYWQQYGLNNFGQCLFRSACKAADCSGLTIAYIKKFGWQEDLLKPLKQATSQNRKPGKSDPLEKYLFHKAEFNIKDETTLDLFEEFLRKSGDCSLECSCKIEEYSIHPCRFNIWYENKRQVDNLNLIFDFISKTKEQEKVSLDLSLIKTFLDKLDLNKVVQIITGIDLRANTKESRLKLWLIIKNYPEKVKQITSFINHPLLSELTFSNELLFGIDIYLDGRTCLKAYPLILEDTLKDDLNRKTLKEMFGETTLRLLETCDRTHISFRSESTKRNLHFHPYNAEKFIESINNEKIKLLSEQVTSSGHKIKILSFSEEEMEKNNIRNINIYY